MALTLYDLSVFGDGLDLFVWSSARSVLIETCFSALISLITVHLLTIHRFSGVPLCVRTVTKLIEYEKHAMLIARRLCEKPAKFLLVFVIGIANRNQCHLAKVYD
jgi:hypothetical protein